MATRKETIASIRKMFERHLLRNHKASYSMMPTEPIATYDDETPEEGQLAAGLLSPTGPFARGRPDDSDQTEKEATGLLTERWAKDMQISIELVLKLLENETVQPPAPPPLTHLAQIKTLNSEEHVDEVPEFTQRQVPPLLHRAKTEVLEPEVLTASSIENLTPLPMPRRSYLEQRQGEKLGVGVGVIIASFVGGSIVGGAALFIFVAGLLKLLS